jgi:regulator of cell morphogenesis and NO signaling
VSTASDTRSCVPFATPPSPSRAELSSHLAKEEEVLFPLCARAGSGRGGAPRRADTRRLAPWRTPSAGCDWSTTARGAALRTLREASRGYAPPADGCGSYRALYGALEALEQDLHQHIHLENNILFPRAIALEEALARGPHSVA